ncbi:XdhC family protein [Aureispira]|nr:XdhC family protein [Aureispira sp.]
MQELILWTFVHEKLIKGTGIMIMMVPESIGSSPGRQGHLMAVSSDGEMNGTIGGGAMEFIQVEDCKKVLNGTSQLVSWKRLIHDKSENELWSGLSCSGEQIVITFCLNQIDLHIVDSILLALNSKKQINLIFKSDNSISLEPTASINPPFYYQFVNQSDWKYQFIVGVREKVYLIGAGHVGLALCRQLYFLNYQVILIDNRSKLDTKGYEQFIEKKIITNYKNVAESVPSTINDYIVIMSFSRALDIVILSQLINKPSRYIGLMASNTKADIIRKVILEQGFSESQFNRVHTPIGIPFKCKSPAEIAVSVAAQMIQIRHN